MMFTNLVLSIILIGQALGNFCGDVCHYPDDKAGIVVSVLGKGDEVDAELFRRLRLSQNRLGNEEDQIQALCDCDANIVVLRSPSLDRPRQGNADISLIAFVTAVSDLIVYVAGSTIFRSDVNFISAVTIEVDTTASPVKTLIVALNSNRDFSNADAHLWDQITDIPRRSARTDGDWLLNYRFEPRLASVTCEYVRNILLKHQSSLRTWSQIQTDLHEAVKRIYEEDGTKSAHWTLPSVSQSVHEAHLDISEVLRGIDTILRRWYETDGSVAPLLLAFSRLRFEQECAKLELQNNTTLHHAPDMLVQAQQRIKLHKDRFSLVTTMSSNQHLSQREVVTDAAVSVYTHLALSAPGGGTTAIEGCTDVGATGALSCALSVVQKYVEYDHVMREEVVEDLLSTHEIYQVYELSRSLKDTTVHGALQIHFYDAMSILLDAGYTPEAAMQHVVEEIDALRAAREKAGGDVSSLDSVRAAFLDTARHFVARPPPVCQIVWHVSRPSRRKRLLRSVVGALVGVTISIFLPPAAAAVLPSLGTLGSVVVTGAAASAASAAINKDPDVLKAAVRGAILAGSANVIGDAFAFADVASASSSAATTSSSAAAAKEAAFSVTNAGFRVIAEGAAGCAAYELTGGKCKHGLVQGAISEVASSARVLAGVESRWTSSLLSGSSSALGAYAMGGDIGEAFLQGAFVDQFNHAMHDVKNALQTEAAAPGTGNGKDASGTDDAKSAVERLNDALDELLIVNDGDSAVVIAAKYELAVALGLADVVVDTVSGLTTLVLHPINSGAEIAKILSSPDLVGRINRAVSERAAELADFKKGVESPTELRDYVKKVTDAVMDATIVVNLPAATKLAAKSATKAARSARGASAAAKKATTTSPVLQDLPQGATTRVLSEISEDNARLLAVRNGEKVFQVQNPSGHGIDVLSFKVNPATGFTEVFFTEVKATAKLEADAVGPHLRNTNHGRQMDTTWICRKFDEIYKTQPDLVRDVLHTMESSHGNIVPHRRLYSPTADNNFRYMDHRLPDFDPIEFHRHLKMLVD